MVLCTLLDLPDRNSDFGKTPTEFNEVKFIPRTIGRTGTQYCISESLEQGTVGKPSRRDRTCLRVVNVVVPASECPQGHSTRELLEALIKTAWSESQEWAVAWKEGGQALKTLVAAQVTQEGKNAEGDSQKTQQASEELHGVILKMKKKVAVLEDLHEQLQTLVRMHADAPAPFITLTFHDMALMLGEVVREYSAETKVKECCLPILSTPSTSTFALNTCNTIWANHQHLRHNLFPIKALLHEIGAL
ncbi:uncharacterized protein LOC143021131 [Oratosquilla oratoria]|uniref:uncharacterized protein LOC143021131 n=1 Tax=Oratosquilla oratoria TaxID=337810 RepID=UPI003F75D1E4